MRHEPCVCDEAPVAMLTWSVDDGWKECLQSKDADIDWWLDPAPCTARGAANRNWHNGDPKTKIIASNPKAKQKHGQELIICKIHVKRYTKRCERCICLKSLSKVWTIDIWYFDKSWNLKECRVGLRMSVWNCAKEKKWRCILPSHKKPDWSWHAFQPSILETAAMSWERYAVQPSLGSGPGLS